MSNKFTGISHILKLKPGTPIMFLRNLSPPKICNGSRTIITRLSRNCIEVKLANSDEVVFVPKLPLILEVNNFKFKRIQFPIRPCFSMTINKSQGQSMRMAGLNLTTESFAHE